MTTLQTINASASPEVKMNENAASLPPAAAFGKKPQTAGFTFGYYGGTLWVDGVLTEIADGTVALTNATTITTDTTSLAALAAATFTVINSLVAIGDVVLVSQRSGATNAKTDVRVTARSRRQLQYHGSQHRRRNCGSRGHHH